jgi:hypothetical protein
MRPNMAFRSSVPRHFAAALIVSALLGLGCQAPPQAPGKPGTEAGTEVPGKAPGEAPSAKVTRIVFLDQQEACDCTIARQKKSWDALQEAIAPLAEKPTVEVVHLDTQADEAQLYLDLKPVMVMPGIYLFDRNQELVEALQGELTAAQIAPVLE